MLFLYERHTNLIIGALDRRILNRYNLILVISLLLHFTLLEVEAQRKEGLLQKIELGFHTGPLFFLGDLGGMWELARSFSRILIGRRQSWDLVLNSIFIPPSGSVYERAFTTELYQEMTDIPPT
jgi:hypothetical protein